jgi:threonine/homoserine/homoserine lactone efflux protein
VINLLLKGALIGFAIAMPVGPIGLLCIRNSLTGGARYGFMTGLGAAAADTFYGAVAGFGITGLMVVIISYKLLLQVIGGLFLCYLGVMTFLAKDVKEKECLVSNTISHVFFSTFFLTITNPMTILSFIGIYAGLGINGEENSFNAAFVFTSGVFLGSACWWLLLSSSTALFKNKVNTTSLRWINRISGSILMGFGFAALVL